MNILTIGMAPENITKVSNCAKESDLELSIDTVPKDKVHTSSEICFDSIGKTKIALSFSVDRLLNYQHYDSSNSSKKCVENFSPELDRKCCNGVFSCCSQSIVCDQQEIDRTQLNLESQISSASSHVSVLQAQAYQDLSASIKSIVRPTPIRARGNSCSSVSMSHPFPSALLQYQQQQKYKHNTSHFQRSEHDTSLMVAAPILAPLSELKSFQINHQTTHNFRTTAALTSFSTKAQSTHTLAATTDLCSSPNASIPQQQQNPSMLLSSRSTHTSVGVSSGKRKRSWSRAVFSNLQRKGLEIQFQQQKYITKPDRRKLAARLNLTDAQVKVWFQNRRMKWRHTRENLKSGQEKEILAPEGQQRAQSKDQMNKFDELSYSSDGSSSVEMSDKEDDEIDVVE